jgi:predicted ribosomally synthesized peptide with nif11-like leader
VSEEQLKAFLEAVKSDLGLQEKLKKAENPDAIAEIAKAAGFMISANEIQNSESQSAVLSDGELEGVVGGSIFDSHGKGEWWVQLCGGTKNADTHNANKYPGQCRY